MKSNLAQPKVKHREWILLCVGKIKPPHVHERGKHTFEVYRLLLSDVTYNVSESG